MDERTARILIVDLGCPGESVGLERRLLRVAGVLAVNVNPATDYAYIRFDGHATSPARLRSVIEAEGYRTAEPVVS